MENEVQVTLSKCYYGHFYASRMCGQYTFVECEVENSFRRETVRMSKCFEAHLIISSQSICIIFLSRRLYNPTYPQPRLGKSRGRKCMEKSI